MALGKACYILIPLLVVSWLWPPPDSRAGVMVPFEWEGLFRASKIGETAITYANTYLKRQAVAEPDGGELRLEGSSAAAIRNLERLAQQAPGDLNLQTALGSALMGVSRSKEAQRVFEQAVRTNPSYAIGHCYLGHLALIEGDRSRFEQHFEQAIQAAPAYLPAYNSLAIGYEGSGKSDEAYRIFAQGIARLPNEASLFRNQGMLYAHHKRWEAAEVSLRNALTRQPSDHNRLVLGMILLQGEQYERAHTVFESILKTNPKNTFALAGLADSYKGRHDYDKAIALIEQAIAIEPTNKDLQDELRMHQKGSETWKRQQKDN